MNIPRVISVGLVAAAVSVLSVTFWLNYVVLEEAYGGGQPYYGRTTNMDKWQDPLPGLLLFDAALLVGCAGLLLARSGLLRRFGARERMAADAPRRSR